MISRFRELAVQMFESPGWQGVGGWFLAWVFAWSGVVKLRRPVLTAMAIVDFRVAGRVRPRLGLALGAVEVGLALVLAAGVAPLLSALLAAGILWLFAFLIARSLVAGERFACLCFGDSHAELSPTTLARTAALALFASAIAVVSIRAPAAAGIGRDAILEAAAAAAALGALVLVGALAALARASHDVRIAIEGYLEGAAGTVRHGSEHA